MNNEPPCVCGHKFTQHWRVPNTECMFLAHDCHCPEYHADDGSPTPPSCLTVNRAHSAYTGRYAPQGGYSVE